MRRGRNHSGEKQVNAILAALRNSGIQAAFSLSGVESFRKARTYPYILTHLKIHVKFPHMLWGSVKGVEVLPFPSGTLKFPGVLLCPVRDSCCVHGRFSFFQEPERRHLSCTIQLQPGPSTACKRAVQSPKDFRAELSRTIRCFLGPKWDFFLWLQSSHVRTVYLCGQTGWNLIPAPQLLARCPLASYLIFLPEPAFPCLHKEPPHNCVLVRLSEETWKAITLSLTWSWC